MRTHALVLVLVSCAPAPPAPHVTAEPNQLQDLSAQVVAAASRMHDRYAWARQIQHEVVAGNLALAQASARVITRLDEPYALAAWQPYLAGVHDAARQVVIAPDVGTAAVATGLLGQRCAECHEASAARVSLPPRIEPPDDPKLAPQMLGHQWAAAEMWDGLIAPSTEHWQRGATALTKVPLNMIAQAVTSTSVESGDDVSRVRLLARRALTTTTNADRAQVFGELLGACVHCHDVLRDR